MSCCVVAPFSDANVAPALRRPCAEQCGRPAVSHQSRILLPKPFDVNGLPYSVTRYVCTAGPNMPPAFGQNHVSGLFRTAGAVEGAGRSHHGPPANREVAHHSYLEFN